jgi:sugar lactone lactonase YvrE
MLILLAGGAAGRAWWLSLDADTPPVPDLRSTVLVLAGEGIEGARDGAADQARFSDPFGVAVASDGSVFVADAGESHRIRRIGSDGQVSTLAGGERGFRDGSATAARFNSPSGLAIDAHGSLYVADTGNNAIRHVTPEGVVTTIAGDGVPGRRNGRTTAARFNGPVGVAVDAAGRIIVADTYNDQIRAIDTSGSVTTLAGSGPGFDDGPQGLARFNTPCGVGVDASGNVFVADTGNGLVRKIDRAGSVTTVTSYYGESFLRPLGIAPAGDDRVFVTDGRGRVVELALDGTTRVVAGSSPGFHDGAGDVARFRTPAGIAVVAPGRIVVADSGNRLVRLVAPRSQLELRLPPRLLQAPSFDATSFGWQPLLWPVSPLEGPHEVAGTMGEARGSDGRERFHAGIDVREDEGAVVHAVRDGVVGHPVSTGEFGSLSEWLRIGPVSYVHVRAGRDRDAQIYDSSRFVPTYDQHGKLVHVRVKRGARFLTGEAIGTVNPFNHVHLNVGWPGDEYNPLQFRLVQFDDTVPPAIPEGGVQLYGENGEHLSRRARGRVVVSGKVQIVADVWDQTDANRPERRLGVYDLGYQVLLANGKPAEGFDEIRHTIRFDRLSLNPDAPTLVYAPGSGIPFFGNRRTRFLYIVTNSFRDGVVSPGLWNADLLEPGDYIVQIWAADVRGNAATENRDLPVTVLPPEPVADTSPP